uniref:Uncharacterized protein n=1 Tax=Moniliophthora roreri TaxID=221103 RepID=A0A0W0EWK2_MONRR
MKMSSNETIKRQGCLR